MQPEELCGALHPNPLSRIHERERGPGSESAEGMGSRISTMKGRDAAGSGAPRPTAMDTAETGSGKDPMVNTAPTQSLWERCTDRLVRGRRRMGRRLAGPHAWFGRAAAEHGPVGVVISYYNARPVMNLIALVDALRGTPAGGSYRILVVVNQQEDRSLVLPERHRDILVLHRRNRGFNIGAWEHGWRACPEHPAYLFLQDECQLVRAGWLAGFLEKAARARVGLVGERLSPPWDAPWTELARRFQGHRLAEHEIQGRPADRVPCYLHFLARHGILCGTRGDHLQTLTLFARRDVLQAMDGLPAGENYGEAIAAEIGISKKVQSLGLTIGEVGPEPFWYFRHPQWVERAEQHIRSNAA